MSKHKKIIYSLHPLERKVLPELLESYDIKEISKATNLTEAEITTALQLLEQREFVKIDKSQKKYIFLDRFGKKFLERGLPEVRLLSQVLNSPKTQNEINLEKEEFGSALGILKRKNLIEVKKQNDSLLITSKDGAKDFLEENEINPLKLFSIELEIDKLNESQLKVIQEFKKRPGIFKEIQKKSFKIELTSKGKEIAQTIKKDYNSLDLVENLTSEMLKTQSWKNKEFRHYDISLKTPIADIGREHPMHEANRILKDIFIEMGFEEMQGPMVESAFWNMDVMWIPQDHPARDEQDTFYLDKKADIPKDLFEKVKQMHEEGIKRTHTPKGEFSKEISQKRLLRTHSTATSFRYLAELGKKYQNGEDINGKYFYIANVFRNEAVDATHLAEFFQGEGFIIADDLSLADLMGFVKEYYKKLGIEKIRFKPTFNPYTEPSMEAHYYDEKLKKWYALINSGIFRPETLKPLGLENKRVIAWGLGASRVAALLSQKDSMRDITGATCDFEWLKTRPMMKREVIRK